MKYKIGPFEAELILRGMANIWVPNQQIRIGESILGTMKVRKMAIRKYPPMLIEIMKQSDRKMRRLTSEVNALFNIFNMNIL